MSKIIKNFFNYLYKKEKIKIIWFSFLIYFYGSTFIEGMMFHKKISFKLTIIVILIVLGVYLITLMLYILIFKPKKIKYKRWMYLFYMRLFEERKVKNGKTLNLFYKIEILLYLILGIFLSFIRKLNSDGSYYVTYYGKWWSVKLVAVYCIIFLIMSIFLYKKKIVTKNLLFINLVLLYFRIFLMIIVLN